MPNLTIKIPHGLTQQEALQRIKNAIIRAKAEHAAMVTELQENWDGNTGTFRGSVMGQVVSGSLEVQAVDVVLNLELPFAAALFKGAIESGIRESATKLLK